MLSHRRGAPRGRPALSAHHTILLRPLIVEKNEMAQILQRVQIETNCERAGNGSGRGGRAKGARADGGVPAGARAEKTLRRGFCRAARQKARRTAKRSGGRARSAKTGGCAAIDSVRPFRFLADKAAVAADFHSENGACYYGKRRIASTASVATLAKTGVVRPGFPCRIASKSGEYPHRSLPFWQAMHGGIHFSLPANCETHLASNARVYTPVQSCWGIAPNP